jgi:hypothetical protein
MTPPPLAEKRVRRLRLKPGDILALVPAPFGARRLHGVFARTTDSRSFI